MTMWSWLRNWTVTAHMSARLADAGVRGLGVVRDPAEMAKAYAGCDVLVSFSRCEMFNLPLAEAGFARKPALALEGIRDYLAAATAQSLAADGEKMFEFVDARFRWKMNAQRLLEFLEGICPAGKAAGGSREKSPSLLFRLRWAFWRLREFVRNAVRRRG